MINNTNLISIIIPCYNRSKTIVEALNSVLAQTHTDWECIIVDDGSTDNSFEVIEAFTAIDTRFRYSKQNNAGASSARNHGLELVRGQWIQFLDSDDIIEPEKLSKQLKVAEKFSNLKNIVLLTDFRYGSETDIYAEQSNNLRSNFKTDDYLSELIMDWETELIIPIHSFLFSSNLFTDEKIRFDTSFPNHVDYDCWLSIFSKEIELYYIDEVLCRYRVGSNSLTSNMKLMGEGFINVLDKHIQNSKYPESIIKVLKKKKLDVLQKYRRFDLMNLTEKLASGKVLKSYYCQRIIDKFKSSLRF